MIGVALCKTWGSQFVEKNRNRCGEDIEAFFILLRLSKNLFQKESDIGNWRSDYQTAFITTRNVYWNI